VTCESYWDPHLVRKPGGHVSFFQMHAPYGIEGGWEKKNKEVEAAVLEKWHKAAPNMKKENIIMTLGESPEDIEIRFPNMRRGGVKHGDYTPMQLGFNRQHRVLHVQDTHRGSLPLRCFYIPGWNGQPAGRATLPPTRWPEDMGLKKWWKPTKLMEKYTKDLRISAKGASLPQTRAGLSQHAFLSAAIACQLTAELDPGGELLLKNAHGFVHHLLHHLLRRLHFGDGPAYLAAGMK